MRSTYDFSAAKPSPYGLRLWRQAAGATQAEAARWYGVSERTWRRYERGESQVPRPLIKRIAAAGAIKELLKREKRQ